MLKKIQNVWNSILRNKKVSNTINIYTLKYNLKASNAISTSIVFFINSLKNIKLKKLSFISKKNIKFNFHFLITVYFFIFFTLIIFFL